MSRHIVLTIFVRESSPNDLCSSYFQKPRSLVNYGFLYHFGIKHVAGDHVIYSWLVVISRVTPTLSLVNHDWLSAEVFFYFR